MRLAWDLTGARGLLYTHQRCVGQWHSGSASPWHGEGRGFESPLLHHQRSRIGSAGPHKACAVFAYVRAETGMKGILRAWGIGALVCAVAGAASAAPTKSGRGMRLRNDVVAVVVTGTATGWTEISVSYPGAVSAFQAAQDLAVLGRTGGWSAGAPTVTRGEQDTQAAARVIRGGSSERAVWAAVWALRRYSRVTFAALAPHVASGAGKLDNRFVNAVWSGGGGMWSCDVTVKDRGFRSVAEMTAEAPAAAGQASGAAAAARQPSPPPARRGADWRMLVIGVVAVFAGLVAYMLAARAVRRAPSLHS